jgi:hypothetical protein
MVVNVDIADEEKIEMSARKWECWVKVEINKEKNLGTPQ